MRPTAILSAVLAMALVAAAVPAAGAIERPQVAILDAGMVSQSFRIMLATSGFDGREDERSTLDVSAWLDGVPIRASVPLIRMPARFAMDLDLAAGAVRIAGITVGEFAPLRPFDENMQFPIEVTVQRGSLSATARATVMIPLPTVVVPGYLSELGGPDEGVLAAFRRHGYRDRGMAPTLFWFGYRSLHMSLEEAAQDLDAYVHQVVLPATFARKVNVVGYSLGGLLARWNIAYNPEAWGVLVNRLILVGVPNEGTVTPYVYGQVPPFLPYAWLTRTKVARALLPTFPFWRSGPARPWETPPDAGNTLLAQLNTRPIPRDIRISIFYGTSDPADAAAAHTTAGVTSGAGGVSLTYDHGDGIVLAASAQGLPILGGPGVPAFADRAIPRISLGPVGHMSLLRAGADRIAAALLDRVLDRVDETPEAH
jgi:pimeloyl-ACP methyl ester carboxylesterase